MPAPRPCSLRGRDVTRSKSSRGAARGRSPPCARGLAREGPPEPSHARTREGSGAGHSSEAILNFGPPFHPINRRNTHSPEAIFQNTNTAPLPAPWSGNGLILERMPCSHSQQARWRGDRKRRRTRRLRRVCSPATEHRAAPALPVIATLPRRGAASTEPNNAVAPPSPRDAGLRRAPALGGRRPRTRDEPRRHLRGQPIPSTQCSRRCDQ